MIHIQQFWCLKISNVIPITLLLLVNSFVRAYHFSKFVMKFQNSFNVLMKGENLLNEPMNQLFKLAALSIAVHFIVGVEYSTLMQLFAHFVLTVVSTIIICFMILLSSTLLVSSYGTMPLIIFLSTSLLFGIAVVAYFYEDYSDKPFIHLTNEINKDSRYYDGILGRENWKLLYIASIFICVWLGICYNFMSAAAALKLIYSTSVIAIVFLITLVLSSSRFSVVSVSVLSLIPVSMGVASFTILAYMSMACCILFLTFIPPVAIIILALVFIPSIYSKNIITNNIRALLKILWVLALLFTVLLVLLIFEANKDPLRLAFNKYYERRNLSQRIRLLDTMLRK